MKFRTEYLTFNTSEAKDLLSFRVTESRSLASLVMTILGFAMKILEAADGRGNPAAQAPRILRFGFS